jgi:hypothetical protein
MKTIMILLMMTLAVLTECDNFLPTDIGDGYFISYNKDGSRKEDIKVSDVSNEFILRKKNFR